MSSITRARLALTAMRWRDPRPWDALLAVAAAGALIADGMNRRHGGALPVGGYVLALATCAPLAWRRDAPMAVLLIVLAGVIACLPVFHPYDTAVFVVMVPLYTVALLGGRRRSLAVGAGTAVVLVVVILLIQHHEGVVGEAGLRLLLALGALVVGDTVRSRQALAAAALRQQAGEAREREAEGRRRVEAERLRIARELHDTIAHALVAINVRAGVGALLGPAQDSDAALTEIKEVSAEALRDLRSTLSLLREPDEVAPTGPSPNLEELPRLVERARAAGIDAALEIELAVRSVPSPVGQAGYRIVQEALTNVMRHAGASTARVHVRLADAGLEIEVTDDGRGGDAVAAGPGLQGMAERANALGGRMLAGPREHAGWRVWAHLPLSGADDR
jgi:signal transduction histidine kinase